MPNTPLLVAALLLVDSLHFVFARLLLPLISPGVSAAYVLAVATLEVGLYGLATRRLRLGAFRRHLWFFLSIGFLVAASTNLHYEAVAFIDPGTATMLSKSGVIFGLGLGVFWLRERLTRLQAAGALLAVAGLFTITFQPGDLLRFGSLLVLASALMYALHAAITKRYRRDLPFLDFFFFRLLCSTGFLLLFSLGRGALAWPSRTALPLLLLVGTVDVAVSRSLYYMALQRLTLSLHTLVLALSPVVTILWSLLLFAASPTPQALAGGAAVIAGVALVTARRPAS